MKEDEREGGIKSPRMAENGGEWRRMAENGSMRLKTKKCRTVPWEMPRI